MIGLFNTTVTLDLIGLLNRTLHLIGLLYLSIGAPLTDVWPLLCAKKPQKTPLFCRIVGLDKFTVNLSYTDSGNLKTLTMKLVVK